MASELQSIPTIINKLVKLSPGGTGVNLEETLVLKKIGGDFTGYHSNVVPKTEGEAWLTIYPDSFGLDPINPDDVQITVKIAVPATAIDGLHEFELHFTPEEGDADQRTTVKVELQVQNKTKPSLPELPRWVLIVVVSVILLFFIVVSAQKCSAAQSANAIASPIIGWVSLAAQPAEPIAYNWEAVL